MKRLIAGLVSLVLAGCTGMVMMDYPPEQDLPEKNENPSQQAEPGGTQPTLKNLGPAILAAYPDLGPAPEIVGEVWLNTDSPLRLADLRGKVILIDMWTFG